MSQIAECREGMKSIGVVMLWCLVVVQAGHHKHEVYTIAGDIMLGVILPVHTHVEGKECGVHLRETGAVQNVEAIAYAIKKANGAGNILPGIRLGMVLLDDCATPATALGQALHFMPVQPTSDFCKRECWRSKDDFAFYDVVGVIGAESSQSSIMIANVLGRFELPVVSPMSTSDLLSDKSVYPYFMRMAPPDRYQVKGIVHLLKHFGWLYVSIVYSKGGYGQSASEFLQQLAPEFGLCIGASVALSQVPSNRVLSDAINTLYKPDARVVVLFTDQEETKLLFRMARKQNLCGYFVWVGSDGLGVNLDDLGEAQECAVGSLSLKSYSVPVRPFKGYFEMLDPVRTHNPWFKHMWSDLFGCTWNDVRRNYSLPMCDPTRKITESTLYSSEVQVSTLIDTVSVFASALDRVIRKQCPGVTGPSARDCVTGKHLLRELYKTELSGLSGNISFDERGDIKGRYEVVNFRRAPFGAFETKGVGIWDEASQQLTINVTDIVWNDDASAMNQTELFSSCGRQCAFGEIYSYYKNTCCWECRKCQVNQITSSNATKCLTCPVHEWPDPNDLTTCQPIPPQHIEWNHPAVIVFVILSLLGVTACCVILCIFIRYNNARLIKATSRELSYILLAGITVQFAIVLSTVSKPSRFVCVLNYIGFNVSFTLVYAPLLTRTNRIHRIFCNGKVTTQKPHLTSPLSQIIIASTLIAIQVAINVAVSIAVTPSVARHMPVLLEPCVELACDFPVKGLAVSLFYNVALVLICTYYAFKARTVPDNFNESRYITLCVYTTLVIWLAFLPTYFLTSRNMHRVILMSAALILSASVLLLSLFASKVYLLFHSPSLSNGNFNFNLRIVKDPFTGPSAASNVSNSGVND